MAHRVFTDAFLSINGVDLSDHVESVTLTYSAELVDDTTMGDTTRTRIGGLLDWSISADLAQDLAASEVNATLFSLVGSTFAVILRADNSEGVGAANPNFTGTGILESYIPVGGSIGERLNTSITIQAAGALSAATS